MICPVCQDAVPDSCARCPECGTGVSRTDSGVFKTSIVMISCGDQKFVYPTVSAVPARIRKRMAAAASGGCAGTVIIADHRGKEELDRLAKLKNGPKMQGAAQEPWRHLGPALVAIAIGSVGACIAILAHG